MKSGKNFLKNCAVAFLSTAIFFICGEIIFRAFFPEYSGFILSENITYGKRKYMMPVPGGSMRARSKDDALDLKEGDHVILVIGDSVSLGYGLAYEDIYWNYWQRALDREGKDQKIVAITQYGNNYSSNYDAMRQGIDLYRQKGINIDGVIYQFNLNDLVPFRPEDLKAYKHLKAKSSWISKIIKSFGYIRVTVLNRSVMLRVMSNKLASLLYDNSKKECRELGIEALGGYTFSFGAKGSEENSQRIWDDFEADLSELKNDLGDSPFIILITPIAQFIDPELRIHPLSLPPRFDCATIDPLQKLAQITEKLSTSLVNPTDYMKMNFENYLEGDNPQRFFFINDDNHINEVGSRFFAEYGFTKIFEEGIIQ